MTQHIKSDNEFKEIILKDKSIIMIHKDNCPFCEKAIPWVEEFSKNSKKTIASANIKNIPKVMEKFQVQMYPTFIKFSNGKVIDTFFGDTEYEKVKKFILN